MTTARTKFATGTAIVALLLTAGAIVGYRLVVDRLDRSIPQTNLFGTPSPSDSQSPSPAPGSPITGPLNFLIVGHDMVAETPGREIPKADAVMILHIDATLTHAYLTSLPRDLLVSIPANEASGTGARSSDKLTHALAYGARVPGSDRQDLAQGFALLARTVSAYTGIERFDGGAVLSFWGLSRLVDVIGGIDMYVDRSVTSIHRRINGRSYTVPGPEMMHYPQGWFHFRGWQALDYARQRYGLPDGAYGRERHHRQMVKAIAEKLLSFDMARFTLTAPWIVSAIGDTITIDLRGRELHEYVSALRDLRPENITLVSLPGGSVFSSGGNYVGEALRPIRNDYFAAVRDDTVADFLERNPTLVGEDPPPRPSTAASG